MSGSGSEDTPPPTVTPSTSLGSMHLIVSMPVPGSANAPFFSGQRARTFLEVLHRLTQAAELPEDESVNQIFWYSSETVQDTIRYVKELSFKKTDKTWELAKKKFLSLYGVSDDEPSVSLSDLQAFCNKQTEKPVFASRTEVSAYHQAFLRYSGPLEMDDTISENDANYYFFAGLPKDLKKWLETNIPDDKKIKSNAPTIDELITLINSRFNSNSLFYDSWKDNSTSRTDRVRFDDEGRRKDAPSQPITRVPPTTTQQPQTERQGVPSSAVDDLVKQLEELKISQAQVLSYISRFSNGNPAPSPSNPAEFAIDRALRCFICGLSGDDLKHRLHPSYCPETPKLMEENLVRRDRDTGKYVQLDGSDLPRIPRGFIGGVAAYLRRDRDQQQRSTTARDPPPHQSRTNSIGLLINGEPALGREVFGLSNVKYSTNPAMRSGKDTSTRYDPLARREGPTAGPSVKGKEREVQPVPSTSQLPPKPSPVDQKPKPVAVPPPTNPINRSDGWKQSLPSRNKKDDDVKMKDDPKPEKSFHYTSDIQQRADTKAVYDHIMNQMVALPIAQILAGSPPLQKMFFEGTKTRREYVTKAAEYSDSVTFFSPVDEEEIPTVSLTFRETDGSSEVYRLDNLSVGEVSSIQEFFSRCSNAILKEPSPVKLYAMVTGVLDITINDLTFTAMIDCGSELNVASVDLPDRASLPVDFEGMNWSLRGIHGNPEQLQGVVVNAPMVIGGHEFPHHLFISHQKMDRQDVILGQPFLMWYCARLQYHRTGLVKMYLWREPDDGRRPTLAINITVPNDPRNKSTIGCPHSKVPKSVKFASAEEIPDDEDF